MTLSILSYPPLDPLERAALEHWDPDNFADLCKRAAAHGLSAAELLAEFPPDHRSEAFVSAVLPELEISQPFLRSIAWSRFLSDWRYRLRCLSRAMKAWREGGWKEACRALVLGIMVAMVPGLSTFVAALGLSGIGALGVRWLANRSFMRHTPLATVLHRVADVLDACRQFLARVFALIETVVDVVIDTTASAVKKVVTGLTEGARQVMAVCRSIARTAVAATRTAVTTASVVARGLFGWIGGWFGRGGRHGVLAPAMA